MMKQTSFSNAEFASKKKLTRLIQRFPSERYLDYQSVEAKIREKFRDAYSEVVIKGIALRHTEIMHKVDENGLVTPGHVGVQPMVASIVPFAGYANDLRDGLFFESEIDKFIALREISAQHPVQKALSPAVEAESPTQSDKDRTAESHAERRRRLDMTLERGARRRILEAWDCIEAEYNLNVDAHVVLRVLKRDKDEKVPALKTIQNHLSVLRREGLIP
jgi:hypothetical protein